MVPSNQDRDHGSARDASTVGQVESGSFLQLLVDSTSDGLLVVDTATAIVFANPAVEDVFGYPPGELVGEPLSMLLPDRLRGQYSDAIDRFLETDRRGLELDAVEFRGLHRDGHEVPLEVSVREVDHDGKRLFVGVVSEATERRRAEGRLERERDGVETELDDVLDRITDAFFALDDEWRFTYLNERATEPLDVPEADLVGTTIWEAIPEIVGSTFEEQYRRAVETQEPVTFEAKSVAVPGTWYEVRAYPSESGLSVYFRDVTERKQYERTLTSLHGVTRDLFAVDSEQAAAERMVETATEVIDLSAVTVFLFDPVERLLRPAATSEALDELIGDPPSFAPGEGIVGRVFVEGETVCHDDVREAADVHNPDTPFRSELVIPMGEHGVFVASSTDVGAFDERTRELGGVLATAGTAVLDALERERELEQRERELERQNRRLAQLRRVNDIVRRIDGALVEATTREGIDGAVCDLLADADQFAFAWVGDVDPEDGSVTPRAWAGEEGGYLDAVITGDDPAAGEPAVETARAGKSTVVADVSAALHSERWRQAALVRGFGSAIAVPLVYDGFTYGVLAVYAAEVGTVDDEFLPVVRELGETIANAINAVETKQGLLFDRVVELDVRIDPPDDVLHRIAAAAGCEVEFEGVVPQDGSASPVFFAATGAPAADVEAVAGEFVDVQRVRLVREDDDGCLFEVLVSNSLVASAVVEYGGIPRSIHTDGAELRVAVDLPYSIDVRTFFEQFRSRYPTADLVAQRVRERPAESRRGVLATLEAELTDRQWEVLRTAHLSGFFEEPRASSGQEIGSALGISQPTFTSHLRAAQRTLFAHLFDELPDPVAREMAADDPD